jgi:hypothetical protein
MRARNEEDLAREVKHIVAEAQQGLYPSVKINKK